MPAWTTTQRATASRVSRARGMFIGSCAWLCAMVLLITRVQGRWDTATTGAGMRKKPFFGSATTPRLTFSRVHANSSAWVVAGRRGPNRSMQNRRGPL